MTPPDPVADFRKPEKVGLRRHFWGQDRHVRALAEQFAAEIESDAARPLRELPRRWPLEFGGDDWCAVVSLLALHLMRTPAGKERILSAQRRALRRRLPELQHDYGTDNVEAFLAHVTSDAFQADTIIRNLRPAISLMGSMQWDLLAFDDRYLATSDQPLTLVPIVRPGELVEVGALPNGSFASCEEIRFPISPSHALLLTWDDGAVPREPLRAGPDIAAQINRAAVRQAERQWYYHPNRRPTTLIPPDLVSLPCSPIARLLVPGYGWQAAAGSERRARAQAILRHPDDGGADIRVATRRLRNAA